MTRVGRNLDVNIDDNQFGGIAGSSTTDALVELLNHWYEATDTYGTHVRVIFFDFAKAFDLINHETLLAKLDQMESRHTF